MGVSWLLTVFMDTVVTERRGRHRFTYQKLDPGGKCTDAMSHILVCDFDTSSIQMIDKNCQFLSYLLIRQPGIFRPISLSYDAITHRIWVGSFDNNKVCVYRYMTRLDACNSKSN